MPKLSSKAQVMPSSPIRKLVPFAETAKKNGTHVFHLNIGQPDIETPQVALDAVKNFSKQVVEYSHSAGFESYRKGLAHYYQDLGIDVSHDNLMVTTGGSEALLFALNSCLDTGDEIIIPEPFYANYNGFSISAGVKVKPITTSIDNGFALPKIEEFEKLITSKTKAILICNPGNPTGYLYSRKELETLKDIVIKHDLFLIADEVYREFAYDGNKHYSILNLEGLEKNSIVIGMQLEPPNLDPTGGAAAAIDEVVYSNVYEGLTRFRADGSVTPGLAKSWTISGDGLVYTFQLQENVKFHNGSDFDASDVKFSIDRARDENSTNAQKGLFKGISSVDVVNSSVIKITLSNPNGGFIRNLAWGDAIILDPDTANSAASEPNGTGPFKFSKWVKGDRVELVKNNDYWGEAISLEKASFKFISDPTAAFAALMAGDVDAFPVYPAPETLAQFEADPNFNVIVGSTEGETILSTNNKSEKLKDVRVRKAIAHAINRQAIVDGAMFGFGTPIGTHFAPHHPDYVDLTSQSNYDPEKSKSLLSEAGVSDGLTLSLKLPPPSYARRGGEIIASQLREVGIETKIENLEWAQWLEQVFKGKDYDLTIVSHTEPMDIGIYGNPSYYFQYDSQEFRNLMDALNLETNDQERSKILKNAQKLIADDYVNGYLFQLAKTGVANSKLVGLWKNSPTQANDLTGVSWSN